MGDLLLENLTAAARHPDLPEELDIYGRLIGSWQVENRFYDEAGGEWVTTTLTWHFGRILDGLGIQDVLRSSRGSGTTVRAYDKSEKVWRVSWFGPVRGDFHALLAYPDGDGIRQEGAGADGRPVRWCFSGITADSFRWAGHISDDGGRTWRLEQQMRASR